jgi:hypothetical protein
MPRSSSGSVVTAWSGEIVEASCRLALSLSVCTRGAVWPRITGRPAPPPKLSKLMPGCPANVSPSVAWRRCTSSSSVSVITGVAVSFARCPSGEAVTTMSVRLPTSSPGAAAAACGMSAQAETADNSRARTFTKSLSCSKLWAL